MPRSSLLNALMRIAADVDSARRPAPPVGCGPKIGRRAALRGAAPLAGMVPALAAAEARVSIVGAGLAGLTAANELSKAGLKPVVHEGSTRLGGRCFSIRSKFPGQIAEHGGEFIDHSHYAIRGLASTLGLQTNSTYNDANAKNYDELWSFDGVEYTHEQATTDYAALHPEILRQRELIGDQCTYKDSSDFARELDQMSLAVWLDKYVPGGRASKLGQLIENALSEELAANSTAFSGLWPAWEFWKNKKRDFELYYPISDEFYHIRGGNDQIPRLLGEKLGDAVQTGTALAAVTRMPDGKVRLSLTRNSKVFDEVYDRVILALPFTTLRQLDIAGAGFRPLKTHAIETLGMGASTKFQLRFKHRVWLDAPVVGKDGCDGAIRLTSDLFQTTWDVTSDHRADREPGDSGILCFWSGGWQAERAGALDPHELAKGCLAEADKLLPGLKAAWTGEMSRDAWRTNPWSLGSYSYLPIGYATTVCGIEAEPEGNCFFAGEHTMMPAAQRGYLNAAVETGQRAAKEVLHSLK